MRRSTSLIVSFLGAAVFRHICHKRWEQISPSSGGLANEDSRSVLLLADSHNTTKDGEWLPGSKNLQISPLGFQICHRFMRAQIAAELRAGFADARCPQHGSVKAAQIRAHYHRRRTARRRPGD